MKKKLMKTMMTESEIKASIDTFIVGYSMWTIGITDNPVIKKQEHKNPKHWRRWDAGTEESARRIVKCFIDKGCKGDTSGVIKSNYVYIF